MAFKHKKRAFSLVELMMLLLVSSLIIAALVPVVTKKHFRLPSTVIHGAYMCYYKNGELYEAKWSGKNQQTLVYDRPTDQCVFSPPQKAAYFQISAIGGGGGGGDAGYTGGNPIGGWSGARPLSPWGITEEALEPLNISKQGFLANAGELWGYAQSQGSGAGGSIGIATKNALPRTCLEPEMEAKIKCTNTYTSTEGAEEERCYCKEEETTEGTGTEGETEGTETTGYNSNIILKMASKITNIFKDTLALKPFNKGKITGAAISDGELCTVTVITRGEDCYSEKVLVGEYQTCYEPQSPLRECTGGYKEECRDVEVYRNDCTTQTETKEITGFQITCRGSSYCSTTAITGDQSNGCRTTGNCTITETITHPPDCEQVLDHIDRVCERGECLGWTETPRPDVAYDCSTYDTVKHCTPTEDRNTTVDNNCTCETVCETVTGDGVEICTNWEPYLEETGNCLVWSEQTYEYTVSEVSGAPGAAGAKCTGTAVAGNFNLGYNQASSSTKGNDGGDKDTGSPITNGYFGSNACAVPGYASCVNGASNECDPPGPGAANPPTSSFFTITKDGEEVSTARAYSASKGGDAGCRTYDEIDGERVDRGLPTDMNSAVPGTCYNDAGLPFCGTDNKNYGYCLKHANSGIIDENGSYSYDYSYDNNYLNYGEPGSPGQFKTVLVRSLKDVDTTIKIGRGGSAAAFNLGQAGAKGSPTSMGSIIFADGGEGGRGGISKTGEVLPKFDNDLYGLEEECYALTGDIPEHCHGIDYTFHIVSGRTFGKEPTPVGFASTIMTFIFNTADNSQAIQKFVKYGRGGAGGGVEHRCWAGRFEVNFEGSIMLDTSVFASKQDAIDAGATAAVAEKRYVPEACRDDWDNIHAGPGSDGALLIKW